MSQNNRISRRDFFKGAALSGAVAAAAGALGPLGAIPAQAQEPTKASFEIPPAPIPADQIKETLTADVVVVGLGIAGMAAAWSAVEEGAKVIGIEKHTTFRVGGGHNSAVASRLMKSLGVEVDKNELVLEYMRLNESRPNQHFARMWAENSEMLMNRFLDLAEAAGIKPYMPMIPMPEGYDHEKEFYKDTPTDHMFGTGAEGEAPLIKLLMDSAVKQGADLRFELPGKQLIKDASGRITGVVAQELKTGNYIQINARRGVILSTGDFGSNPEMMQKYCTPSQAKLAATNNCYMSKTVDLQQAPKALNTGDGHLMAMWVGGQMEEAPHPTMGWSSSIGPGGAFLRVNLLGERYENEDVAAFAIPASLARQPEGKAWQILDGKYVQDYANMHMWGGMGAPQAITEDVQKLVESMYKKADTIEELAQKIGVPIETFKATIARRNELAKLGEDLDFGLPAHHLTSIEVPPFYAGARSATFAVTVGGIITNGKLQPLDVAHNVIPGLYLAGNTVGRRFGLFYLAVIPGLSNGMAWTEGYFAGKYAAAEQPAV